MMRKSAQYCSPCSENRWNKCANIPPVFQNLSTIMAHFFAAFVRGYISPLLQVVLDNLGENIRPLYFLECLLLRLIKNTALTATFVQSCAFAVDTGEAVRMLSAFRTLIHIDRLTDKQDPILVLSKVSYS